jgi:hypothetical protein
LVFPLVLLFFGNGLALLPLIGQYWLWILLLYIPAGIITAFGKWYFFCRDCRDAFDKAVCGFKAEKNLAAPDVPSFDDLSQWLSWMKWMYDEHYGSNRWIDETTDAAGAVTYSIRLPVWTRNKGRICTWMMYWWIVAPWSFLSDFVHRLFKRIMQMFGGWFNKMAAWVFGNVPSPIVVPPTPPAQKAELPARSYTQFRP